MYSYVQGPKCPFCGQETIIVVVEAHTHKYATHMLDYSGDAFLECSCGAAMSGDDEADIRAKWAMRDGQGPESQKEAADGQV